MSLCRAALAALLLAVAVLGLVQPAAAQTEEQIPSIELSGELSPAAADWIGHALSGAADDDAPFAIIRLDTPGGLDSAAEEIVDHIRTAPMPVVVFVYPGGAAASDQGSAIVDAARTGHSAGDGICWSSPVGTVIHNRTGAKLEEVEAV